MTIVAKATYSFDREGTVALSAKPDPVVVVDETRPGGRAGSLARASDAAPYLLRGDVTFEGSARKEAGPPAVARLAIVRDGAPLVDKRLVVRGPAAGEKEGRVALVYENGLGGAGVPSNPAGRPDARIVHPANPAAAAGFGPIPASWPARRGLLRRGDEEAWTSNERVLRDGFPLEWFQTAPADQRLAGPFVGTETVLLEGLVPGAERVRWELGAPRVEARRLVKGGGFETLPVALDTLRIEGDALRYSLVWRGYLDVSALPQKEAVVVAVGIAKGGEPIAWPEMLMRKRASAADAPAQRLAMTEPVDVERLAAREAPFEVKPPSRGAPSAGKAAPWARPGAGAAVHAARVGQHTTVQQMPARADVAAPVAASQVVVMPEAAPAPPRLVLRAPPDVETGGTIALDGGLGSELLVAFAAALRASRSPRGNGP